MLPGPQVPGRTKLASFRTFRPRRSRPPAPIPGRSGEIGFVLHNRSSSQRLRPARPRRELGSFRIFCPPGPRPGPSRAKLGLFRTIGLPDAPSSRCPILPRVWLCFAQLGLQAWVRLLEIGFVLPRLFTGPTHHNSFFAKYLPSPSAPGQLGLFRTFRPRRPRPPAPIPGRSGGIGFVSHNRPSSPRPRPTRPRRELGLFVRRAP